MGSDLSALRDAIASAKAKLLAVPADAAAGTLQDTVDDAIVTHVSRARGPVAAALPKPTATDIIQAPSKAWYRKPWKREIFLVNKATKCTHASRPPIAACSDADIPVRVAQLAADAAEAWCGWSGWEFGTAKATHVAAAHMCEKCFGRPPVAKASSASSSATSSD